MVVTAQQKANLVSMLDGYVEKGGHHLNVNVLVRETLLDAQQHPPTAYNPCFGIRCKLHQINKGTAG